jgi:hypothetical protein
MSENGNHAPNIIRVVDLRPGSTLRDGRVVDYVRFTAQMFARVHFIGARPQTFMTYEDVHLA